MQEIGADYNEAAVKQLMQSMYQAALDACLHRSYLDSSSIQVSIYDDRLEVDSPGMLYDGLNVTDALAGKSKCRNTAIVGAFQYMKIIEGWGTGLPRLFRQCREMGLPEPKFEEFGEGIKVTIYRTNGANEANHEANEAESGAIQDQILRLIEANPKISQTRIAKEIGVSRSTIQRAFGKLIESGQVQRTGGTRGSWIIQEKH